ncbi:hypothetical protein RV12_GL001044 [Enterococcus quebecensis]|nr:hypothetical protein RV12_GL001044 [Enterococcus quebecensis]
MQMNDVCLFLRKNIKISFITGKIDCFYIYIVFSTENKKVK